MLANERKKQILMRLSTTGQVLAADLVRDFGVSEDTIRRDLKDLADSGQLKKVHGGAVALTTVPYDYSSRKILNVEAKSAMARRVLPLIRDGMVVFIDGGTTCVQLAYHLSPALKATFITHSVATAMALAQLSQLKVIVLGGQVIPDLLITSGPELVSQSNRFKPDLSLISAHGLTLEDGATVESWDDAAVKETFLRNSAEIAVLAGYEKIGFRASYRIADIKDIAYLISDAAPDLLEPFAEAGLTIWHTEKSQ
jgi:DeoR/GlpR family transcriptional regulator of sugar metabolism